MSQTVLEHSPNAPFTTPLQREIRRIQNEIVGKSNDVILTNLNARKCAFWCITNIVFSVLSYYGL